MYYIYIVAAFMLIAYQEDKPRAEIAQVENESENQTIDDPSEISACCMNQ